MRQAPRDAVDYSRPQDSTVSLLYIGIALFYEVYYLISVRFMGGELFFDAAEVWLPIAKGIANGGSLYVEPLTDNKSPVWHALNYLVYQTGHYTPVFILLTAVANATVAFLLYRWLANSNYRKGGVIAGLLYLAATPFVYGTIINVRSFAMVCVLAALLSTTPIRRGVWTALAVLLSQYSIFAIPILALTGSRQSENAIRWLQKYCVTGALVGVLAFMPLLYWGTDVLVAGVQQSFLNAGNYVLTHADHGNPFTNPGTYIENHARMVRQLLFLLVPSAIVIVQRLRSPRKWALDAFAIAVALAVSFGITLLLRSLQYYWLPPSVFLAAIVGIGVESWFTPPRTD
ncbi:hypothetical protein [Halobacterium salinarum]|uniref:hypothetical protein n=1 Tax=Halobacterium salinarum TaxID=2242 RepID=UPI0025572CCC|nr:hypothetical protein [Halobacterium salinarum]MDL0143201.1 hypothetical protein [Halobacterium salinarum]